MVCPKVFSNQTGFIFTLKMGSAVRGCFVGPNEARELRLALISSGWLSLKGPHASVCV